MCLSAGMLLISSGVFFDLFLCSALPNCRDRVVNVDGRELPPGNRAAIHSLAP